MSRHCRSVLFLLQRCVAARQVTLPTSITKRCSSSLLSGSCGFIQQRTWTSTARAVCQLQSAVRSSQYRFCTKVGESSEDEYPPLPDYACDPAEEDKEPYIIQVRGLPWTSTAEDLQQFFSECRIRGGTAGIHLTLSWSGRPTGRAIVEMENREDVSRALEKHRHYLGSRYIEVREVKNSAGILDQVATETGVVRLSGLPYSCTNDDILNFFSGLEIVENGITHILHRSGRISGVAFVRFSSQEAADEALKRDREYIRDRFIRVSPSRSSPSASLTRSDSASRKETESAPRSSSLDHYIHIRGLPFNASIQDVIMFFSPLVLSKIVIELSPGGKQTGEADVYFRCSQDAMDAMSRDRRYIGERYIELFLNSMETSRETR